MKILLCILMVFSIFSGTLVQAEKYANGVNENYPPFAFVDEKTGKPTGFDVDAMSWIAKEFGFEIEHRVIAQDAIIAELVTGEIDMICSGFAITDVNKYLMSFSDPYLSLYSVFLVHRGSELRHRDILNGEFIVAVKKGTPEAVALIKEKKEKKYPFEIVQYDDYSLIKSHLLLGIIDATIMDALHAEDMVSNEKSIKIVAKHGEITNLGVAFRKDDGTLRRMINQGYKLLKADPYWEELKAKYLK